MRARVIASILILAGVAGFAACTFTHVCMCGHLAHPENPLWDLGIDAVWVGSFLSASLIILVFDADKSAPLCLPMTFLLISRLIFQSGPWGMLAFFLELPAAVVLALVAIVLLYRTFKFPQCAVSHSEVVIPLAVRGGWGRLTGAPSALGWALRFAPTPAPHRRGLNHEYRTRNLE